VIAFIAVYGKMFGVGPVCEVLQVAPSSYYAALKRPASARAQRDESLKARILQVWEENRKVYGARKVWWELQDGGLGVARCTVERLMRALGICGTTRGRPRKTTTAAGTEASRPADLVNRDFTAPAPNRRWVADITYIPVRTGFVYAAFVIDLFSRMIVGWKVSASLRSDLALDALEMAVFARSRGGPVAGVVHHSDRGSQYLSIRYGLRLAEAGAVASAGTKGDSYDNAAAESFNGLYKAELIWHDEPEGGWAGVADVGLATAGYVAWFNRQRRHSACERMSPARFEAAWHARQENRTGQKPGKEEPGTGSRPRAGPG
jgi:putative transposase